MSVIKLTLKNGAEHIYGHPVTGLEITRSISTALAEQAVAVRNNGVLQDLKAMVDQDALIEIIARTDPEGLTLLRHDAAHIMAEAVQELFPGTQVTIGPAIENGFYYDFYPPNPFVPEDLALIEAKMHEIVARDEVVTREVWEREKAIEFFKGLGEDFKVEIIEAIPANEPLTVYRQGNFTDLCRGPHLPSTGKLGKAFKLMSLAGAYWRGDARNPMLQRIYGTAWADESQLQDYLHRLAEAEKRDHRRLGPALGLFHIENTAPGTAFWHPKGGILLRTLQSFIRNKLEANGYEEIYTPHLVDRSLWEASGHWDNYRENMFTVTDEHRTMAIKPMNCPGAVQIFKQGTKSYRDLPLRLAEFGICHRNESSGSMHGLLRVRAFLMDDAHIFCTPQQIVSETQAFCHLLKDVYQTLGFKEVLVKFSDRPLNRAGNAAIWDYAEKALQEAALAAGLSYILSEGDGAFYGPKLEFTLVDVLGRQWQCGTLQVDFVLPERLDAEYIGEDGQRHRPVMLHRAIFGSFERFIGILIEHYEGKFPLWLAPVQVAVATITNEADVYGTEVYQQLKAAGLRAILDKRNEKITYKIREHSLQKIPIMLVVGKREAAAQTVAIRRLGDAKGDSQQVVPLSECIKALQTEATLVPSHNNGR